MPSIMSVCGVPSGGPGAVPCIGPAFPGGWKPHVPILSVNGVFPDASGNVNIFSTSDYTRLVNRPCINGNVLTGDQNGAALGLQDALSEEQLRSIEAVNVLETKLSGVEAGAQVNVIESVEVNGAALAPSGKAVNIDLSNYVQTGDSRLSDARAPTAHKSTHAAGGADALTPADIGAATAQDVAGIEAKIPGQASSSNQLADKAFVNSSIATNTANYVSDNGQPFASLAALQAYSGTLTHNDYAFVVGTDASGGTTYTRYKYNANATPPAWAKEYVLNNSSFTAEQWAAISSGITGADVTKLSGVEAGAQANVIETVKVNGVALTPDANKAVDVPAYQKPQGGIPASDMAQAVQASLGKANTALQRSGDTMTGGLTVPNLTVGSRMEGSTIGEHSTAEGYGTMASGECSHTEGTFTTASGECSHAEGDATTASGQWSHAEGDITIASGECSHAEGSSATAGGDYSHAEGDNTTTQNVSEHAQGCYNASHRASDSFGAGNTLSSIGFGHRFSRKNAVEVMQDGKTFFYGVGGYDGTNPAGQPNAATDIATVVNGKAPLASPAFTGTPTVPTAPAATNNTQAATTAFVHYLSDGKLDAEAVADAFSEKNTYSVGDLVTHDGRLYECNTAISEMEDWNAAHWTEKKVAPLASPAFTGTPTAPTPAAADNSTNVATTAFVKTALEEVSEELSGLAGKVGAKYTKPQGGIPADDMTQAVQTSLGRANNSVQPSDLAGYIPFANLFGEYSKTSVAIGYSASVIYRSQPNINAIALGREARVWAVGGVAIGQRGIAADEDAVVITANIVGDQTYPSHGVGTLNLGSRNGMRGIYIQHMHLDSAMAFLLAGIPEVVAPGVVDVYNSFLIEYTPASPYGEGYPVNAYFCHGGRLYRVVSKIDDGIEWEDIPASKYKEVTLREVLFASPAFTGTPTAPTPAAADNSTNVATTAFVKTAISGISVTPLSGRNFDFATTQGVMDALKATIEALGGTVTNAPTTPAQNNQTQGE